MLEMLSENRDLKAQVEKAERMLTRINIEKIPFYASGFEDGEAEGEARGEAGGKADIVRRLLTRLDLAQVADLLGFTPEEVERIAAAGGDENSPCERH